MYLHVVDRNLPIGENYGHKFYKFRQGAWLTRNYPWHLFSPSSIHDIWDGPFFDDNEFDYITGNDYDGQ